jgi:hypothetical protein
MNEPGQQSDIDLAMNAGMGSSIYIGNKEIKNATYYFNSILECRVGLPTI